MMGGADEGLAEFIWQACGDVSDKKGREAPV